MKKYAILFSFLAVCLPMFAQSGYWYKSDFIELSEANDSICYLRLKGKSVNSLQKDERIRILTRLGSDEYLIKRTHDVDLKDTYISPLYKSKVNGGRMVILPQIIVSLPSMAIGQEPYKAFLTEGKVWTYNYNNVLTGQTYYKSLTVSGDTVIDAISYRKIVDATKGDYEYGMREEGSRVFCRFPHYDEHLIYDFGLAVGDSFGDDATVVSVGTIMAGSQSLRVLDVRPTYDPYAKNCWLEGVGSMYYLTTSFPAPGNNYSFYSCQMPDGTLITSKDVVTLGMEHVLTADNDESTASTLYDLQGRRVTGMPRHGGVYVQDGRKVVVK